MGLNIIAYRLIGTETEPAGHGFPEQTYYKTETFYQFDSTRYSGDRDFVIENEFISPMMDPEERYNRPKDFVACRKWIENRNMLEGNKKRLLDLLESMEKDESIHLCFSW